MEYLDRWATSIGDSTCRYLGSHGYDGLRQTFCSDGDYSAGWRVIGAVLGILACVYVGMRMFRTS